MIWERPKWQYARPDIEKEITEELLRKSSDGIPSEDEIEKLLRSRYSNDELNKAYEHLWKNHPFATR